MLTNCANAVYATCLPNGLFCFPCTLKYKDEVWTSEANSAISVGSFFFKEKVKQQATWSHGDIFQWPEIKPAPQSSRIKMPWNKTPIFFLPFKTGHWGLEYAFLSGLLYKRWMLHRARLREFTQMVPLKSWHFPWNICSFEWCRINVWFTVFKIRFVIIALVLATRFLYSF